MSKLGIIFLCVAVAALGVAIYVRAAPSDPSVWHRLPDAPTSGDFAGSAVRIVNEVERFEELTDVARATPRTKVLAGSVEQGMITFVTRSAVMGFPDYTTIGLKDDNIVLHARLRFGKYDMGVNAKRLDAWLQALKN